MNRMTCFIVRAFSSFRAKICLFDLCFSPSATGVKYPVQKGGNYANSFVAVTTVAELAQMWHRFDFENLAVLAQMMERFGVEAVLKATDSVGKTISHWIACRGTPAALKYIVDCDPKIVNTWHEDRNNPLVHMAFIGNNIEVLDVLLEDYGLDINIRNMYGQNVLMQTILTVSNLFSNIKTYDILLSCYIYGIDVNAQNMDTKQTALHYAVQRFNQQDVYLLLRLGANLDVKDMWERTPYDYAVQNGDTKLAKILSPIQGINDPKPSIREKVTKYFQQVSANSRARNRQMLQWGGMAFSIAHIALLFSYLLPMYFFYYLGRTWNLLPLHVIMCICIVLTVITGLITVFSTTNFLPTGTADYSQLMNYVSDPSESPSKRCKMLNQFFTENSSRLCHTCRCIGPEYSKHCYLCGRCCSDYDHHCFFLHTCIGEGNIFHFVAFTTLLGICGGLGLLIVGYSISLDYRALNAEMQQYNWWYKLYKVISIFTFINLFICFKFMMTGLTMSVATVTKRRRDLASRNCNQSMTEVKLI